MELQLRSKYSPAAVGPVYQHYDDSTCLFQMVGIGSSNLIVGALKDRFSYKVVLVYFLCCATVAWILTLLAIWLDKIEQGGLLKTKQPLHKSSENMPLLDAD